MSPHPGFFITFALDLLCRRSSGVSPHPGFFITFALNLLYRRSSGGSPQPDIFITFALDLLCRRSSRVALRPSFFIAGAVDILLRRSSINFGCRVILLRPIHEGILSLNRPLSAGLISFEMTRLNEYGTYFKNCGSCNYVVSKRLEASRTRSARLCDGECTKMYMTLAKRKRDNVIRRL